MTVRWSGVTGVKDNDWIGVYLSPEAGHTEYLDYVYASDVRSTSLHHDHYANVLTR